MTSNTPFHRALSIVAASAIAVSCVSTPPTQATTGQEKTLADLISDGRNDEVKKRFSGSDSINQKDSKGQTLLHVAALKDNADMVQFLLDMKADTEIKNNSGETPLAAAVKADCLVASRLLAKSGAGIFAVDAGDLTVYRLAREHGAESFSAIISENSVRQRDPDGRTALHLAAVQLDEEAIGLILEAGSEVSTPDSKGQTPLSLSYANPGDNASAMIAARLLLAGAEPLRGTFGYFETAVLKRNLGIRFEEGKTPLHIAAANGHSGFVNYLLGRKAPVNVKDVSSATPLHEAVRGGHIECTRILLAAGADPNQKEAAGNTPLHLVMPVASRSAIFSLLLEAKADPNQKDSYGETALHIAARLGMSEDIIRALVSAGADINERNKKGITPLSLAIERRQVTQAALFVQLGADIHAEDMDGETAITKAIKSGPDMVQAIITPANVSSRDSQGRTPLHVAALAKAEPAVITFLISRKADVNARDKNGDTALHIAIRNNDRANGEVLLAIGADVFYPNVSGESALKAALTRMGGREDWVLNSTVIKSSDGAGNTPLHLAAEWQLAPVVSFITQKGGDPNARNANGETPLFNAVKSDSGVTIRALLSDSSERKSDVNARDFLGNTALHACIRWSSGNAADTLLLFDGQSNGRKLINARNLAGKTALHEAARTGSLHFIHTLIAAGADINAVDETGKTALTDGIQANRVDAVRALLNRGASPVMQDMYGRNAFHEAVESTGSEVITLLRNAGANPMSRDSWGKTPLSLAFKKGPDTVMAVIGSNVNLVDSDGNTPLHIAVAERASEETLRALISARYPVNNRNRTGTTALLLAIKEGDGASCRILLSSGADPFATDNSGDSAVSVALVSKQDLLQILAEYAADKSDTVGDGLLHYAARVASPETVGRLLTLPRMNRAARNIAGETPYDVAVRWQHAETAELLK